MDQIGNYRILQKLGEGGMGEVFRAVDTMLEREVALKLVRDELSQRGDIVQRFRSEAVALGRLNHPNIVTVYAFARDGDRYYMALEFVEGDSLAKIIARHGRMPWQNAARYACAVLSGLDHAHRLNVIHRDVKPANILVAMNGMVKIMDFGIARILERARQTRTGGLVCTLEYASPEQIRGLEVDARSDVYSMGVVMYEMLTGRMPFEADTEYALMRAHVEEQPIPPRNFTQDIPQALERIVLRALAKKPGERFPSAAAFLQALQQLLGTKNSRIKSPGRIRSQIAALISGRSKIFDSGNWPIRHWLAVLSALVLLGAAGILSRFTTFDVKQSADLESGLKSLSEGASDRPQSSSSATKQLSLPSPVGEPIATVAPIAPGIPLNVLVDPGAPAGEALIKNPSPKPGQAPVSTARAEKRLKDKPAPKITLGRAQTNPKFSAPDDDDAYWRNLERSAGDTTRSGSSVGSAKRPRKQRDKENADYWREIQRDSLESSRR